jgi:hypothetical protein
MSRAMNATKALELAREWERLTTDADFMMDDGEEGEADHLRTRADDIKTDLENAGYDVDTLLNPPHDDTGIETDLPKVAKAIKVPVLKWPGRCHEIAGLVLKANLVPKGTKLCYGIWHGPIDAKSLFAGRSITHHGWLTLPDGRVYDPTRWCFLMSEPFIYVGEDTQGYYDFGGNTLRESLMDCSKPPEPHGHTIKVPLKYRNLFWRFIPSTNANCDLPINQLMWLGSLPLARLGEDAKAVYSALVSMKLGAFIPIDNRQAILS